MMQVALRELENVNTGMTDGVAGTIWRDERKDD